MNSMNDTISNTCNTVNQALIRVRLGGSSAPLNACNTVNQAIYRVRLSGAVDKKSNYIKLVCR